jgi:hypothetical protein
MLDHLELTPLVRVGEQFPGGTFKSERHFLDFIVNGQSLWEALGKRHDMVSILCAEYSTDETAKSIGRLLLREKAALPNDRRSLFVCSECGDLGCGSITVAIDKQGETITWNTFGYENTYEDKIWLEDYCSIGPFTFNGALYESTLLQGMANLSRKVK